MHEWLMEALEQIQIASVSQLSPSIAVHELDLLGHKSVEELEQCIKDGLLRRYNYQDKNVYILTTKGLQELANYEATQDQLTQLKKQLTTLAEQNASLVHTLSLEGEDIDGILADHIESLHRYNEIKDVGQMLLGKLAVFQGCTTRQLYPEFDLELND